MQSISRKGLTEKEKKRNEKYPWFKKAIEESHTYRLRSNKGDVRKQRNNNKQISKEPPGRQMIEIPRIKELQRGQEKSE